MLGLFKILIEANILKKGFERSCEVVILARKNQILLDKRCTHNIFKDNISVEA